MEDERKVGSIEDWNRKRKSRIKRRNEKQRVVKYMALWECGRKILNLVFIYDILILTFSLSCQIKLCLWN